MKGVVRPKGGPSKEVGGGPGPESEGKRWLVEMADLDDRRDEWVRWDQTHVSGATKEEAGRAALAEWREKEPKRADHRLVVLQAQEVWKPKKPKR